MKRFIPFFFVNLYCKNKFSLPCTSIANIHLVLGGRGRAKVWPMSGYVPDINSYNLSIEKLPPHVILSAFILSFVRAYISLCQ